MFNWTPLELTLQETTRQTFTWSWLSAQMRTLKGGLTIQERPLQEFRVLEVSKNVNVLFNPLASLFPMSMLLDKMFLVASDRKPTRAGIKQKGISWVTSRKWPSFGCGRVQRLTYVTKTCSALSISQFSFSLHWLRFRAGSPFLMSDRQDGSQQFQVYNLSSQQMLWKNHISFPTLKTEVLDSLWLARFGEHICFWINNYQQENTIFWLANIVACIHLWTKGYGRLQPTRWSRWCWQERWRCYYRRRVNGLLGWRRW